MRASMQQSGNWRWTGGHRHAGTHRRLLAATVGLLVAVVPTALGSLAAGQAGAETASTGSVSAFGDAIPYGAPTGSGLNAPVVGVVSTPDGKGYWLVGADGGVFTYGDAGFYGSEGGSNVLIPFVGIAPTPDGRGYWIAGDFGNVYPFGDAPDEVSLGVTPAAPVAGIAATPTGVGYWLVGADGGVFSFGDAAFYGSMGGKPLNAPMVGMASTPDGRGYWLVAADGGVFSFGDASFYGSMGAAPPSSRMPVVGMAVRPDGAGYWLTNTDKALSPPTSVPSVLDQCTNPTSGPAVKPSAIVLACGDGNDSLINLTWSSWTPTTATATGDYTDNTCTPDCANGTFVSAPTTVRLRYPMETSAGREFAQISYTVANSSAPGGLSTVTSVAPTSPG